jgi:hypothetical protein
VRRIAPTLLAATLFAACSGPPPAGPLGQESDAGGWSTSLEVGRRFADGDLLLRLPKEIEGIVIRDVEPLLSGDGLTPLGVRMALPDRPMAAVQMVDSWPPEDPDVPEFVSLEDATLSGEDSWGDYGFNKGYELFVGFEVTAPGRTTVQGYRVTYEHAGEMYSLVIPQSLAVCAYERGELPDSDAPCEFESTIHSDDG